MLTLNVNSLQDFALSRSVLEAAGLAARLPAVEILWDNFCHLQAEALAQHLLVIADRASFHVMWSRFLERDQSSLEELLERLSSHVRAVKPITVSEHLCRFTSGGLNLPEPCEHSYDDLDHTSRRVEAYQRAIGMPLLLENFASNEQRAEKQIAFLERLMARTGCGLLFDISNAVVGSLNQLGDLDVWLQFLVGKCVPCHVGSYAHNPATALFQDTHATDVSALTLGAVDRFRAAGCIASVSYERDANKDVGAMAHDLRQLAERLK